MGVRISPLPGIVTAALVLVGCGAADTGPAATSPEGDWIAVSGVSDGSEVVLIDGFAITISIQDDQIVGTAACNRYSGEATIGSDGSFGAGELSWTEIGCEPAVLAVEQSFLASLSDVDHYGVARDVLTLSSESDEWVFERLDPSDDEADG